MAGHVSGGYLVVRVFLLGALCLALGATGCRGILGIKVLEDEADAVGDAGETARGGSAGTSPNSSGGRADGGKGNINAQGGASGAALVTGMAGGAAGASGAVGASGASTGTQAQLGSDKPSLDFGSLNSCQVVPGGQIVITNSGGTASSALVTTIAGAGFSVLTDGCNTIVLQPNASCSITVVLDTKLVGTASGMLTVTDTVTDSVVVALTGKVVDTGGSADNCGACGQPCSGTCVQGVCCAVGESNCQGQCINPKTDSKNCGGCGQPCGAGLLCSDGKCVADCGTKSTCGTSCVDTKTDLDNCGACSIANDHQCKAPVGGTRTCSGGVCQASCGSATNCSGTCVDLTKNATNCGSCGTVCGSGKTCISGICCAPGQANCSNICVDTTSSAQNCGACNSPCSGKSCCSSSCVNVQTDKNNCGTCGKSCGSQACCGGACLDLQTDRNNCGACGNVCAGAANGDAKCVGGVCQYTCDTANTHLCTDTCYDNSDPAHCGTGCSTCTQGSICSGSTCKACPSGMVSVAAGNFCIDAREVTNTAYAAFLAQNPSLSGQPARCAFNTSYVPSAGWPASSSNGQKPVVYVDWCDAYAYCRSVPGRRLCGKIGGGSTGNYWNDAKLSQWFASCTAGATRTFPYGSTYKTTSCNGLDYAANASVAVGTLTACVGGYPGLYDMSGNVWEWEDLCNTSPDGVWCAIRGGAFDSGKDLLACDANATEHPETTRDVNGIRCCSDP